MASANPIQNSVRTIVGRVVKCRKTPRKKRWALPSRGKGDGNGMKSGDCRRNVRQLPGFFHAFTAEFLKCIDAFSIALIFQSYHGRRVRFPVVLTNRRAMGFLRLAVKSACIAGVSGVSDDLTILKKVLAALGVPDDQVWL